MHPHIQLILDDNHDAIARLCATLGVRELHVFGSALTESFDPPRSDVDVVVEFLDPCSPGIADRFMALAEGLEAIFQRPVDLITRQSIRNPVFRQVVEQSSKQLYAA